MSVHLNSLADSVSKDFLEKKIPMNESIQKLAQENNLNKNQVARVVERANQATYLSLFNNNKDTDKYASVKFDLADPEVILTSIAESKKEAQLFIDDYAPPKEELDKVAECKSKKKSKSFWENKKELTKKAMLLESKAGENRVRFNKELEKFANTLRYEIMTNNVSFSDVNAIFPETFVEKIAGLYKIPGHEKTASTMEDAYINEDHPLIKSYNTLSSLEDDYIELHKEARELYKEAAVIVKEAPSTITGASGLIQGIAADIAKAWNVIKEVPAKHLVGYPAAFLLGVMYQKSKNEPHEQLSPSTVPLVYRAYQ